MEKTWTGTFNDETYVLTIERDVEPDSPRFWDVKGKMICFSDNPVLGDDHDFANEREFLVSLVSDTNENHKQDIENASNDVLKELIQENYHLLPLYFSGTTSERIRISTTHFPTFLWSHQVGYIFAPKTTCSKETLEEEVMTYDYFLRGEGYQYTLKKKNDDGELELISSCSGFFGSDPLKNGMLDYIKNYYPTFEKHYQ